MRRLLRNLLWMAAGFAAVCVIALAGQSASAQVVFADGFESTTPEPPCPPVPAGYSTIVATWEQVFGGPSYPNTQTDVYPVGSFTFGGMGQFPLLNKIIVVPFVAFDDGSSFFEFDWIEAVPRSAYGYAPPRPAWAVYLTVSPCAGDVRLPVNVNPPRPELAKGCRKFLNNGSLFYQVSGSQNACVVTVGQTYYLNIVFADPYDGLQPDETTCVDGPFGHEGDSGVCEILLRHR